ncbi:WYL domain-containing protein [Roseimaritima sediminicola]|uniref:WYL domain-containing protein n=1 Tax=Roseimaritima sediminicola TaxID=2662066 RepID=UPI001F2B4E85|nr:WYL domain-containing protein [Roseimaritima sediminicola]
MIATAEFSSTPLSSSTKSFDAGTARRRQSAGAQAPAAHTIKDSSAELRSLRRMVLQAASRADDLVIQFDYRNAKGETMRRVVSPIRFMAGDRFLGLCLCREEPRQFYLDRCRNARLLSAAEVLMPVEMVPA